MMPDASPLTASVLALLETSLVKSSAAYWGVVNNRLLDVNLGAKDWATGMPDGPVSKKRRAEILGHFILLVDLFG